MSGVSPSAGSLQGLLLLVGVYLLALAVAPGTAEKTNIVMMVADDLGWGDVEYNSVDPLNGARTPNLNAMAASASAFRLDNFHTAGTACSPTRSSLLSGRTPDRECVSGANAKFQTPGKAYRDSFPFRKGMGSIARNAKMAGYATGFFGKWHLGPFPGRGPGALGFDTWVASAGNVPTYDTQCFLKESKCIASRACKRADPVNECTMASRQEKRCGSMFTKRECHLGHYANVGKFPPSWGSFMMEQTDPTYMQMTNMTRYEMSSTYLVDRFEQFVYSVPPSKAFFAYVWFHEPHGPFIASPEIAKACMDGIACKRTYSNITIDVDYYGAVIALDRAAGRIRSILHESGRWNNTIVIFTSDNGPASPHAEGGPGSAGIYRGYKTGIKEGSHRVPGIIEWPARIKSNAAINGLTSTLDFYNTFEALFRLENPSLNFTSLNARPSDGVNLLPMLTSTQPQQWRRQTGFGICLPIQVDSEFCGAFAYLTDNWRVVSDRLAKDSTYTKSKQVRLFDVQADPMETTNLALKRADILKEMLGPAAVWVAGVTNEYQRYCKKAVGIAPM